MTPYQAYYKAKNLGLRIPKLEPTISQNVYWSYHYAKDVIKDRFILAEPTISKDVHYGYLYAINIIKGKWELAEPTISKDTHYSYLYAKYAIKGRLPDFMHNQMILENNEYTRKYIKYIK